ncbi:MAG TPA: hypothetical protein VH558_01520 [Pseudolabrys sp.]|jgi:hypothetical protein
MSLPSKRFILPYEPQYTAHRTDSRVSRTMRLHRVAQRVTGPSLVPDAGGDSTSDGGLRRLKGRLAERSASFGPAR